MEKNADRLKVIDNIKQAVEENNFHKKVELADHIVTAEERQNVILKYYK